MALKEFVMNWDKEFLIHKDSCGREKISESELYSRIDQFYFGAIRVFNLNVEGHLQKSKQSFGSPSFEVIRISLSRNAVDAAYRLETCPQFLCADVQGDPGEIIPKIGKTNRERGEFVLSQSLLGLEKLSQYPDFPTEFFRGVIDAIAKSDFSEKFDVGELLIEKRDLSAKVFTIKNLAETRRNTTVYYKGREVFTCVDVEDEFVWDEALRFSDFRLEGNDLIFEYWDPEELTFFEKMDSPRHRIAYPKIVSMNQLEI